MAQTMQEELKAVAEKHLGPLRETKRQLEKERKLTIKEFDKKIAAVKADIASAEAALASIIGVSKQSKKSAAGTTTSGKPSAPDEQRIEFLEQVVGNNSGISIKEVISHATKKLAEAGYTTRGQYSKMKSLLDKGEQFAVTSGKVTLAKAAYAK